jgi:hypothetical protein
MKRYHPTPLNNSRIGFQYFPDSYHYRESDLITWLPEFKSLGAQWLVLETPADRAIPEDFLRPLISAGIEPILNMHLPLSSPPKVEDISVLFNVYAQWGVNYISLYDRPNTLQAWTEKTWMQEQLVDRFLNAFIPLAEAVCEAGMHPIFPAMEPGGNFWDTAFLRTALQGIQARKHTRLLEHLVIGGYAWPSNQPLNWGAGGPERWPGVRPYNTPEDEQDHIGFRIFDWYTSITESVLGSTLPIILLGTGSRPGDQRDQRSPAVDIAAHAEINMQIAKLLSGENTAFRTPETPHPVPDHILAGCFTGLVESAQNSKGNETWYLPDGDVLPIVHKMKSWYANRNLAQKTVKTNEYVQVPQPAGPKTKKPIKHYLLLPRYEWGVAAWYLEASQPYIQKYSPTIGFSIKEAFLAEKVTVVGGIHSYPDQLVQELEKHGSTVVEISGNGTDIATQLTIK